ncbi:MAG: hypothetical protein AAF682_20880 [Planctomycetota bacterium]
MRHVLDRLLLHALLAAPLAAQATFTAGDLFLNSTGLIGPGGGYQGVLRIDPLSGVTEVMAVWNDQNAASMAVAYDPFRDRVLASGRIGDAEGLYALDALAGSQLILPGADGFSAAAPTGDGRVYVHPTEGLADRIQWIDASGTLHTLLDVGGAATFFLPSFEPYSDLIFDPATNSLLMATRSTGGAYCPVGGAQGKANFWRLPLTDLGDALREPPLCTTYDISDTGVEWTAGWSRGPGGSFLVGLDGHTTAERSMLIVDAPTMAVSEFCGYGSGLPKSLEGGTYSHLLGATLMVDGQNDALRSFGAGEFGDGTELAIDAGLTLFNGWNTRIAAITDVAPNTGLSVQGQSISLAAGGSATLQIDLGPAFGGDAYFVAGSLSGWAPPLILGSLAVPLVFDGYTSFTLNQPNSPVLPASFGLLDAAGRGGTAFVLAAGTDANLAGLTAWHAALALSPSLAPTFATNAVPVELLP